MTDILPDFVTFTGIDEWTDLRRVEDLSSRYPIEWGILFGNVHKPRYPSLRRVCEALMLKNVRFSAHLCGWFAESVNGGTLPPLPFDRFARIQVNAGPQSYRIEALRRAMSTLGRPVIVQCRGETFGFNENRDGSSQGFPDGLSESLHPLHDESGGQGVLPRSRPPQGDIPYVGYAGGLGPNNIAATISSLDASHYWLDMETGIRGPGPDGEGDRLDLDQCERVCREIWG